MREEARKIARNMVHEEKEAKRAARENAGEPGLQPMAADPDKNILARCRFNTEGQRTLYGTALMIRKGERRLTIAASRGWTPGFSTDGGDDGDLSALAAMIAENAPEIEAHLSSVYAKAAKNHTFIAKEKKAAE